MLRFDYVKDVERDKVYQPLDFYASSPGGKVYPKLKLT